MSGRGWSDPPTGEAKDDLRDQVIAPFIWYGRTIEEDHDEVLDGLIHRQAYACIAVRAGRAEITDQSGMRALGPGQVAVLAPGTSVRITAGCAAGVLAFDLFHRPREPIGGGRYWITADAPSQPLLWWFIPEARMPMVRNDPDVVEDIWTLCGSWRDSAAMHLRSSLRLATLVIECAAAEAILPDHGTDRITDGIGRAIAVARAAHGARLSVDDLARHAGVSRAHFTTAFTRRVGLAPGDWLDRLRIHRARTMLSAGDVSVGAVAHAIGYPTGSFIRRFRQIVGVTPAEYVKGRPITAPGSIDGTTEWTWELSEDVRV